MTRIFSIIGWGLVALVAGIELFARYFPFISHSFGFVVVRLGETTPSLIRPFGVVYEAVGICLPFLPCVVVLYLGVKGLLWGTRSKTF